jgi:hypothetical protein
MDEIGPPVPHFLTPAPRFQPSSPPKKSEKSFTPTTLDVCPPCYTKIKNSKKWLKTMKTKPHPTRLCHHLVAPKSDEGGFLSPRLAASKSDGDGLAASKSDRDSLAVPEQPGGGTKRRRDSSRRSGSEGGIAVPCFSNSRHGLSRFVTVCSALISI